MKKNWMFLVVGLLMMSIVIACGFSFGETGLSDEEKLQTAVAATVAAIQPSPIPATLAVPTDTAAPAPQSTATQPLRLPRRPYPAMPQLTLVKLCRMVLILLWERNLKSPGD